MKAVGTIRHKGHRRIHSKRGRLANKYSELAFIGCNPHNLRLSARNVNNGRLWVHIGPGMRDTFVSNLEENIALGDARWKEWW